MIALNRYHKTQNETASPQRLMVLLFEAALRHNRAGIAALEAGKRQEAAHSLTKASDIVAELIASLDHSQAPAICKELDRIYTFVATRLTSASCSGDVIAARDAERTFAPIADAFSKAVVAAAK